jgi:hypothetical protein
MVLESLFLKMDQFMKENGKTTKKMEKENIKALSIPMKENGKIINFMALESMNFQMVIMREILKMIKNLEKENMFLVI